MSKSQLFRPAALNSRHASWLGNIVLVRPLAFTVLTAFAVAAATIICAFLFCATYTKRSAVAGQLIPDTGLVKVYVPQSGIVFEKYVVEGQSVKQGDILYVLSSERRSSRGDEIQASVSTQVTTRRESLRNELNKTRLLQQEEKMALLKKIASLQVEIDKLSNQVDGQKSRVKLAEDSVARYQGLATQDYISKEQLQQKEEELLDQRNRLQSLERDHLGVDRDLSIQKNEVGTLALRQQNQVAQLDRGITGVDQELTESEAKRRIVIIAPTAGVATAVGAEVGQTVDASKSLVSIVPAGATLQAHLYAPSGAIGFIKPGNVVLLRYQAYPYQKFGHARGIVMSVSKTTLSSSELTGSGAAGGSSGEPMYHITVRLAAQTITAYGQAQSLQAGMLVNADVLQETRRLYEWVLEPLYSLTGKL